MTRAAPGNLIPTTPAAASSQANAEQALRAGRFETAVQSAIRATAADPDNGPLHLFQSLAFFAYGDYRSATNSTRRGLALLEESGWGRVVERHDSFYPHNDYRAQLDGLSASAQRNATQSHLQFLAGYHQLFAGDMELARDFLSKATQLEPDDPFAPRLLALTAQTQSAETQSAEAQSAEAQSAEALPVEALPPPPGLPSAE